MFILTRTRTTEVIRRQMETSLVLLLLRHWGRCNNFPATRPQGLCWQAPRRTRTMWCSAQLILALPRKVLHHKLCWSVAKRHTGDCMLSPSLESKAMMRVLVKVLEMLYICAYDGISAIQPRQSPHTGTIHQVLRTRTCGFLNRLRNIVRVVPGNP